MINNIQVFNVVKQTLTCADFLKKGEDAVNGAWSEFNIYSS